MKRSVYEAPVTERFQIEMEGGFCSGSATVENTKDQDTGTIDEHKVNTDFTTSGDFSNEGWD